MKPVEVEMMETVKTVATAEVATMETVKTVATV